MKLRSRGRIGWRFHHARPRGIISAPHRICNLPERQKQRLSQAAAHDPFYKLSNEVVGLVLDNLGSKDIANLRLASTRFGELPDILFRRLLFEDLPWFWEARELCFRRDGVNWFSLYWQVKFGWGHLKGLVNRKRIWKMVEEIVRRIEEYRNDGYIPVSEMDEEEVDDESETDDEDEEEVDDESETGDEDDEELIRHFRWVSSTDI